MKPKGFGDMPGYVENMQSCLAEISSGNPLKQPEGISRHLPDFLAIP